MSEKVNSGLEKIFFQYILDNPDQYLKVEPHFFKNDDIQFIYTVVRDEYIVSKKSPSLQQILAMVKLNDPDKKIADNLIKIILKKDNDNYDLTWITPRFKAWKLSKSVQNHVLKSIEYIRGIEEINYDNVVDVSNKIKNMFLESQYIDSDDSDLGDDFDDIESHQITDDTKKMPSGWSCIDKILNGGWDQASLNILIAETGGGKCQHPDSELFIRNKITGLEDKISSIEFFNRIKNNNYDEKL